MAIPEGNKHYNNQVRNVRIVRQGKETASPGTTRRKHPATQNVTTTTPRVSQVGSAPSIDEKFSEQYTAAGIQQPRESQDSRRETSNGQDVTRSAQASYHQGNRKGVPGRRRPGTQSLTRHQRLKLKKKKPNAAKTALTRTKATTVNLGIWSWGLFTWLMFQLPLAILNIVMLGAAVAVDALKQTLVAEDEEGSMWYYLGDMAVGVFETLIGAVSSLIGFDISAINPTNIFLITYAVIIGISILKLLCIYLVYKLALLRPLSGEGSGMKFGALLLALVGYSIPVLNLFPWFIPWTITVWVKPK